MCYFVKHHPALPVPTATAATAAPRLLRLAGVRVPSLDYYKRDYHPNCWSMHACASFRADDDPVDDGMHAWSRISAGGSFLSGIYGKLVLGRSLKKLTPKQLGDEDDIDEDVRAEMNRVATGAADNDVVKVSSDATCVTIRTCRVQYLCSIRRYRCVQPASLMGAYNSPGLHSSHSMGTTHNLRDILLLPAFEARSIATTRKRAYHLDQACYRRRWRKLAQTYRYQRRTSLSKTPA